jgi:hypothetical protein
MEALHVALALAGAEAGPAELEVAVAAMVGAGAVVTAQPGPAGSGGVATGLVETELPAYELALGLQQLLQGRLRSPHAFAVQRQRSPLQALQDLLTEVSTTGPEAVSVERARLAAQGSGVFLRASGSGGAEPAEVQAVLALARARCQGTPS